MQCNYPTQLSCSLIHCMQKVYSSNLSILPKICDFKEISRAAPFKFQTYLRVKVCQLKSETSARASFSTTQ